MKPKLVPWLVAIASLEAAGCGASSNSAGFGTDNIPTVIVDATAPNDASDAGEAGQPAPPVSMIMGSPLCNAACGGSMSTCYPDELAACPTTTFGCRLAPDGGSYDPDGGYADAGLACHVSSGQVGAPTTQCTIAGAAVKGDSCTASTDCAAGYECVGSPGVCRHYCCSGQNTCDLGEFCDIQPSAADSHQLIPVCVPLRPCGLLGTWSDAGACPQAQSCAVVRDNGATSCLIPGDAGPGASCSAAHCQAGLVCLGPNANMEAHSCFKLCHVDGGAECASGEVCMAALPLFPDPAVGVCQPLDAGY